MAIYFYKTIDEYGCFSNFSKHGFELEGKYWMTSEHYFQAKKFIGSEYEEKVRLALTPMEAANSNLKSVSELQRKAPSLGLIK